MITELRNEAERSEEDILADIMGEGEVPSDAEAELQQALEQEFAGRVFEYTSANGETYRGGIAAVLGCHAVASEIRVGNEAGVRAMIGAQEVKEEIDPPVEEELTELGESGDLSMDKERNHVTLHDAQTADKDEQKIAPMTEEQSARDTQDDQRLVVEGVVEGSVNEPPSLRKEPAKKTKLKASKTGKKDYLTKAAKPGNDVQLPVIKAVTHKEESLPHSPLKLREKNTPVSAKSIKPKPKVLKEKIKNGKDKAEKTVGQNLSRIIETMPEVLEVEVSTSHEARTVGEKEPELKEKVSFSDPEQEVEQVVEVGSLSDALQRPIASEILDEAPAQGEITILKVAEEKLDEVTSVAVQPHQAVVDIIEKTTPKESYKTVAELHEEILKEQPPLETGLLWLHDIIQKSSEPPDAMLEVPKIVAIKRKIAHIHRDINVLRQEANKEVAKKDADRLVEELVDLLRTLGYKNPEAILKQFMQQYDLQVLVELLGYTTQHNTQTRERNILPKVQLTGATKPLSKIGKYVLAIFRKNNNLFFEPATS